MNEYKAYLESKYKLIEVGYHIWVQGMSRENLAEMFARFKLDSGVEIGVHLGEYSETLCAKNSGLKLYCIDHWKHEEIYGKARLRLARYGCKLLRLRSDKGAECIADGSQDLVYIDAHHGDAYVTLDLKLWPPKVRKGGIVAGHDFHHLSPKCQVIPAVNRFISDNEIKPLFVTDQHTERNLASSWFYIKE